MIKAASLWFAGASMLIAPALAQDKPMKETQMQDGRSSRIPLLDPKDMTPQQRADYEANAFSRTNLSRLLKQAPTLAPAVTNFNQIMATDIAIPPHEREIMVLAVLHLDRGEYEWAQHRRVADFMGIPKAKVDAIAAEKFGDPVFTDRERALLAFTRQVVKTVRVDDPTFNAVAAFYTPRQIVESILVISNYMMILRVSEVAELPIDGVAGADFWKEKSGGR